MVFHEKQLNPPAEYFGFWVGEHYEIEISDSCLIITEIGKGRLSFPIDSEESQYGSMYMILYKDPYINSEVVVSITCVNNEGIFSIRRDQFVIEVREEIKRVRAIDNEINIGEISVKNISNIFKSLKSYMAKTINKLIYDIINNLESIAGDALRIQHYDKKAEIFLYSYSVYAVLLIIKNKPNLNIDEVIDQLFDFSNRVCDLNNFSNEIFFDINKKIYDMKLGHPLVAESYVVKSYIQYSGITLELSEDIINDIADQLSILFFLHTFFLEMYFDYYFNTKELDNTKKTIQRYGKICVAKNLKYSIPDHENIFKEHIIK